ncbi:MAG: hypothetical protein JKX85_12875 [Phycisphaeraceae bacterium]|nr:hypothetical protein [Phycisphaeraceae bacterium]
MTMQNKWDLITLGLNAVDVLIRMPKQIKHDDKQFVDDLTIQGGAPVGSGSCGVARLGFKTGIVARLGENTLSHISRQQFADSDVSLDLIITDQDSRPAIALVEIDPITAARTVFIQMDHYGYIKPDDVPADAIANARLLLVDNYDLDTTERALQAAQNTPCQTVLDFEAGDLDRMRKLLPLGDHLIFPLAAAQKLSDQIGAQQALTTLRKYTQGLLIATDGIHGSWALLPNNTIHHQPAFVIKAVDTTGCGDAFHAGYMVGLLLELPLEIRMELGALLASVVAMEVGGRQALPFKGEFKNHLRNDVSDALRKAILEHSL